MYFVLIPGTEFNWRRWIARSLNSSWGLPAWLRPNSKLVKSLQTEFPNCEILPFGWSGSHLASAREAAGNRLAIEINRLRKANRPIVLIGHSHGGNVAIAGAYHAPFADVSIVTLNTPFIQWKIAGKAKMPTRLWNAVNIIVLSLVFFASLLMFWRSPQDLPYLIAVLVIWIALWTAIRWVLDRLPSLIAVSRRSEVAGGPLYSRPIRTGKRCLVVGASNDEILAAFRNLSAWSKENMRPNFEMSALVRPLIGFGVFFVIGYPAMAAAKLLAPSPWMLLPMALSFGCLVGAVLSLLAAFTTVPLMTKQILAIVSRFGGLSAYSGGVGGSLAYADANLVDMPRADAGAIVERFHADIGRDLSAGLILKGPKGAVPVFRSRDSIKAALQLISGTANFLRYVRRFQIAKIHSSPYDDDRVIRKICQWV